MIPLVGQLIDIKDSSSIPKSERCAVATKGKNGSTRMALVRLRPFVEEKAVQRPSSGDYCHIPYSMKEVAESQLLEWVPVSSVTNICFIFHISLIQNGLFSCGGMDRVYYIRFLQIDGKFHR
jgi:hypothetical protein